MLPSLTTVTGFAELSKLSSDALKSTVKVRFVNAQGLPEAGIDESGVFKVRGRGFLLSSLKVLFSGIS